MNEESVSKQRIRILHYAQNDNFRIFNNFDKDEGAIHFIFHHHLFLPGRGKGAPFTEFHKLL